MATNTFKLDLFTLRGIRHEQETLAIQRRTVCQIIINELLQKLTVNNYDCVLSLMKRSILKYLPCLQIED